MSVVRLDGSSAVDPSVPQESVVAVLERLLERARSGAVQGVAVVSVSDRQVADWTTAGFVHGFDVVGALEIMKVDLCAGLAQDADYLDG